MEGFGIGKKPKRGSWRQGRRRKGRREEKRERRRKENYVHRCVHKKADWCVEAKCEIVNR